jgi:two-component system, sensor histidine kinase YesM
MFRYSINTGKEIVPLSSEIDHVKNYIYIQKLRFKDRFDVIFDIEENLKNNKMIKLVLQPLVENALHHGIESKKKKCIITLSAKMVNGNIEIVVEDTGVGMDENQLQNLRESLNEEILHAEVDSLAQRSIGIKNVHARIRLYFGENYGLSIDSRKEEWTRVTVTIPEVSHD